MIKCCLGTGDDQPLQPGRCPAGRQQAEQSGLGSAPGRRQPGPHGDRGPPPQVQRQGGRLR